jgi:uncharacterized protein YkwD
VSAGADAPPAKPPAAPSATSAASSGPEWDDSHMRSLHRETPRTTRPRLVGESGYGALARGTATPSAPSVQELEFTTQREWAQGPLSTGSNAKQAASASARGESSSSGLSRSSALRGAAQSGRR